MCNFKPRCELKKYCNLREVFLVDGREDGVQGAVGRGQGLYVGQELRAGLRVPQSGQAQSEKTFWILSTCQNFPQRPAHQGFPLIGASCC